MLEIWLNILLKTVTCTVGAVGFCVLFYIPPKKIPLAAVGSALTIGIYLILYEFVFTSGGEFLPNFVAALAGAIYCEIMARCTKTPVPVYQIPAIITLAPGRLLYNTMSQLVNSSYLEAGNYAWLTLQAALGIAGGIIGASVVGIILRVIAQRLEQRRREFVSKMKF